MSPADQPQTVASRRSTDPPSLWLSLALGSVLIHLVLFILVSLVSTRAAKVQLDLEPIAVEFVDPNTAVMQARSTAPSRAIAARPGAPSSAPLSSFQAQSSAPRSQPSEFSPPVEQPFVPRPSARPRRVSVRPQPQQPNPFRNVAPRPSSPSTNPVSPQSNSPVQPSNPTTSSQEQPLPTNNPFQGTVPGSTSNSSGDTAATTEPTSPAEGTRITQPLQGENVGVTISSFQQPSVDIQSQGAKPTSLEKTVLLRYPPSLAKQLIRLQADLVIDQNGSMVSVDRATSDNAIDPETLNELVRQIFIRWQFEPAQTIKDGKSLKPPQSNLTVKAQVQLP